ALGPEGLVVAGRVRTPQIVVEDALELRGARERDQLARVFEADAIDELAEHRAWQLAYRLDQPGAFEDARQQLGRGRNLMAAERFHPVLLARSLARRRPSTHLEPSAQHFLPVDFSAVYVVFMWLVGGRRNESSRLGARPMTPPSSSDTKFAGS